ncbi:MAG: GTP cyclohydrolase I FolE [Bdellovibrionales bacterium]|nr:GTP cyclohydrolase I FolE [Bdellovibrionales bacterium]
MENHIQSLLKAAGEDPSREGLQKTPMRYLKALSFLTSGYRKSVKEVINGALFEVETSELIIVRNIEIYSLCEHHLLPFYGKCHVGYIPNKKIVGLSKVARIADVFARRFQVQERLTGQIADAFMEHLEPQGVGVVIEAYHLCMMMRGVEKQNSSAQTSALRGQFQKSDTRNEFFNLIK